MAPVPAAASAQQRTAPVPVDSAGSPIWLTAGPTHLDVATRPMRLPPRVPCDRDRLPRVDPSSPAYHGAPPPSFGKTFERESVRVWQHQHGLEQSKHLSARSGFRFRGEFMVFSPLSKSCRYVRASAYRITPAVPSTEATTLLE